MSADSIATTPPIWMVPLLDRLDRLLAVIEQTASSAAPSGWVSAAELATLLGVSERSIRTWETTGELPPPVKVGRLKKWNVAEVTAHLKKSLR